MEKSWPNYKPKSRESEKRTQVARRRSLCVWLNQIIKIKFAYVLSYSFTSPPSLAILFFSLNLNISLYCIANCKHGGIGGAAESVSNPSFQEQGPLTRCHHQNSLHFAQQVLVTYLRRFLISFRLHAPTLFVDEKILLLVYFFNFLSFGLRSEDYHYFENEVA